MAIVAQTAVLRESTSQELITPEKHSLQFGMIFAVVTIVVKKTLVFSIQDITRAAFKNGFDFQTPILIDCI